MREAELMVLTPKSGRVLPPMIHTATGTSNTEGQCGISRATIIPQGHRPAYHVFVLIV